MKDEEEARMDRFSRSTDPTRLLLDRYMQAIRLQEDMNRSLVDITTNILKPIQPWESTFKAISKTYIDSISEMNKSIAMFASKYHADIVSMQDNIRFFAERAINDANSLNSMTLLYRNMQSTLLVDSWRQSIVKSSATLAAVQNAEILEDAHAEIQKFNVIATDFDSDKDVSGFFARLVEFIACLPNPIKFAVLVLILPIIQGIASNLVTPKVQEIISGAKDDQSSKVIAKVVSKNVVSKCPQEFLWDLRFVTTTSLIIREYPKKRSRRFGNLYFGDVVSVLQNKKGWTLIEFSSVDSQTKIRGWVYSRYLRKFN
jgi:Bacterial SH3 domain